MAAAETRRRNAAANLEFETAACLRDELKRLKPLDLEFANEVLTPDGEAVDRSAPKQLRAEARGGGGAVQEGAVVSRALGSGCTTSLPSRLWNHPNGRHDEIIEKPQEVE